MLNCSAGGEDRPSGGGHGCWLDGWGWGEGEKNKQANTGGDGKDDPIGMCFVISAS